MLFMEFDTSSLEAVFSCEIADRLVTLSMMSLRIPSSDTVLALMLSISSTDLVISLDNVAKQFFVSVRIPFSCSNDFSTSLESAIVPEDFVMISSAII